VNKIGHELIAAQQEIPESDWSRWLYNEFRWNERIARRYMGLAECDETMDVDDQQGYRMKILEAKFIRFTEAAASRELHRMADSVCVSACNFDPLRRGIGVQN